MLKKRERQTTIRKKKRAEETDRQTDCRILWRIKTETALVEQLN